MNCWPTANKLGFRSAMIILEKLKYHACRKGETIVTEGEVGNLFYVLVGGTLEVSKTNGGVVATLTKGQTFGGVSEAKPTHQIRFILLLS